MQKTAVVCEFNPIHPGHRYLLRLAKTDGSAVIAVMSGHFMQRGIPALCDKYVRAEAAIRCGADLVLELPFPWSASGAEDFARGGAALAAAFADSLTFGSESADLDLLRRAAEIKASAAYTAQIRETERMQRDHGSAVLFDAVMRDFGLTNPLGPNDKLAAEYIRFGRSAGMNDFRPVRRTGDAPSAASIREQIRTKGFETAAGSLAEEAVNTYRNASMCPEERYYDLLFAHCRLYIREDEPNDLLRYAARLARVNVTAAEFLANLPTRKYTAARMRREILHSILGVKPENSRSDPRFTVLLAANSTGREVLADVHGKAVIPIITKPADYAELDEAGKLQYALHTSADALYAFLMGNPGDCYLKKHPVIL